MAHIIVIGAGQLGTTFCILLDQWRRCQPAAREIQVTLLDRAPEILSGATRCAWIDHATGFEYFKRGEIETGKACIQGSIIKRLMFPKGLHDVPNPIRNRFFISKKSGSIAFNFQRQAGNAAKTYQSLHNLIRSKVQNIEELLVPPDQFWSELSPENYEGVNPEAVIGGVNSAGGIANLAMDFGFKHAALQRAIRFGSVRHWKPSTSILGFEQSKSKITVRVSDNDKESQIEADYVVLCAAHGNSDLARLLPAEDLRGSYHLNFMLHASLPPTSNSVLQRQLGSVNFVLQAENGGMFACVVPPSEHEFGIAAMFAPGIDGSYIDEYTTNSGETPPMKWDDIIRHGEFPGKKMKIRNVLSRIHKLNPFLNGYLTDDLLETHKAVVGSTFNPHGDARELRRLVPPVVLKNRLLAMTSPKWTTAELAALTLLQNILERVAPSAMIPTCSDGFGPYNINFPEVSENFKMPMLSFHKKIAEKYLDTVGLPHRILPAASPFFLG